jgi:ABC-type lipoprotein release transport system permease subunit
LNPVILALALSNLTQNPRRTLLAVSALGTGLAALVLLWSFNDGLHGNMVRNFQDTIVGSLQIHRSGFFERPELERHIETPQEVVDLLQPLGIAHWSTRLETFALAASEEVSAGVILIGLNPERESLVTRLPQKVDKGAFFSSDDRNTVILGAATANNLKIQLGDSLVLVAYNRFGQLVAEEFELSGLITSGEMGIDRGLALVPLTALQEMLEMDERVTNVLMRVESDRLDAVAGSLRESLPAQDYEVMRWDEMFPVMKEWIILHDGFLYLFMGVMMLIVLGGVLNTLLLSMLERTREFGILLALGNRRREIAALIVLEALFVGAGGILLGLLLGISIVTLLGVSGIDLSGLLGNTARFYVDPVIHPHLQLGHLGAAVLVFLLATLAASLYPAWRATRLEPVEAIRNG